MSISTVKKEKSKVIDQMLEDFAGDEFDEYDNSLESSIAQSHKHYLVDEEANIDIDELY